MTQFQIVQFLARQDNFGVLLHDEETGTTASIDAPDADAVERALAAEGWTLTHILVTHHHEDHVAGIPQLKESYSIEVTGPERSASNGFYDRLVRATSAGCRPALRGRGRGRAGPSARRAR